MLIDTGLCLVIPWPALPAHAQVSSGIEITRPAGRKEVPMGKFDGLLLVSDFDDTLYAPEVAVRSEM